MTINLAGGHFAFFIPDVVSTLILMLFHFAVPKCTFIALTRQRSKRINHIRNFDKPRGPTPSPWGGGGS